MVFGNKPRKKAKSLNISDQRKLCVLNVDFKVMKGIEEAQIKKTMDRKSSHLQLVSGGSKRISHGIALARDAINAANKSREECGMLDTNVVAAFCNMVSLWCFRVLIKKGLDPQVIDRYLILYTNHLSIIVVNNIQGR